MFVLTKEKKQELIETIECLCNNYGINVAEDSFKVDAFITDLIKRDISALLYSTMEYLAKEENPTPLEIRKDLVECLEQALNYLKLI